MPKIKRSALLSIMYCMGIGGLILCIGALNPISEADRAEETINIESDPLDTVELGVNLNNYEEMSSSFDIITPSPTPFVSPTPLPIYEMTKDGYPQIDKFFQDYYVAKHSCDIDIIKSLLTDPEKGQSKDDLDKETKFLDDIRDITCYKIKSYEKDAYIVYVYYEMKYVNINTTSPMLDKFYLITDKDGELKIFNSEMDEALKTYYDDRNQDKKVKELIKTTNDKVKEAIESDEDLSIYLEALYN